MGKLPVRNSRKNRVNFDTVNQTEKAMNIDRVEFLNWMDRIMKRFDILAGDIENREKKRLSIDGEELLDNQDVLQMLKITYRCLQRYRTIGKIKYFTISGKVFYKSSDVHQFIRDSYHGGKYTPM